MIYFMQSIEGGPIKIGYTDNLEVRHKQLEAHYGCRLAILATIPGGYDEEAEIHRRFSHLRLDRFASGRGPKPEQFQCDRELLEFIGRPLFASMVEVVPMLPTKFDPERNDIAVKVDRTVIGKAKLVATHEGISLAEFLSGILAGPVDKRYAQMLRDLEGKGDAKH